MKLFIAVISFCSCLLSSVQSAVDVDIQNKNVDRTIDLASQLVKISYKITLEHRAKKPVERYTFILPAAERKALAYLSVKDSAKKELKYTEETNEGVTQFTVNIPGTSPNPVVYIETVSSKSLQPYPEEIQQSDRQLVRYFGNAYFYSPYKTLTQKTAIHLSSKNVESYTSVKPASQSDTTITYGSYDNIAGNFRNKTNLYLESGVKTILFYLLFLSLRIFN